MQSTGRGWFAIRNIDPEHYRIFVVVNYMAYLGFFSHLAFVPLFLWLNVEPLAWFNVLSTLAWGSLYFLNRRGHHRRAILIGVLEVLGFAVLGVYFLSWSAGTHYYLITLVPFLYFNTRQRVPLIVAESVILLVLYVALYVRHPTSPPGYVIETAFINGLNYLNISVNFVALAILGYYHRSASTEAETKMRRLATTDTLTSLANRRHTLDVIARIESQMDTPWTVALTDIDHFKLFNDQWGHACGDEVLVVVAGLLKEEAGRDGHAARWGGEEFLLLFPEPADSALARADSLRQRIENARVDYEQQSLSVTLTIGLCEVKPGGTFEEAIQRADEMLYKGKQAGRNRVVVA